MNEFVEFLLKSVYCPISIKTEIVDLAFEKTVKDVNYHFQSITRMEIKERIISNKNELAIFLFRLGNIANDLGVDSIKPQIHWLLKQYCSCEIYFNNVIDEGFYIVHGQGTVIGSRNVIGRGFVIHQGCTIGHKINGTGAGNFIGNNVTLYANSSILGELTIGNNVVIGAHLLLTKDIPDNKIVTIKNINN
jgi:serine O-acetyltransferase